MGVAVKTEWIASTVAQPLDGSRERTVEEFVLALETLIVRAESVGMDLDASLLDTAAAHFRTPPGGGGYHPTPREPPPDEIV